MSEGRKSADNSDNCSSSPTNYKDNKGVIAKLKLENSVLKNKIDDASALNSRLEDKIKKLEQTLEVKNIILKKFKCSDDSSQKVEPLSPSNMKMLDRQEYKNYEMLSQMKYEYAEEVENLQEVISQMSLTMHNFKDNEFKCKALFEAVLDKDIRIQELEDEKEDLENTITEMKRERLSAINNHEINDILTQNNAMKINMKNYNSRILELEASNKDLTLKILQLKANQVNVQDDKKDICDNLIFYQQRCAMAEKNCVNLQKSINKVAGYLSNIGLSIDEIKEACSTGVIKFGKINTDIFKIECICQKLKPQVYRNNVLKSISEESDVKSNIAY